MRSPLGTASPRLVAGGLAAGLVVNAGELSLNTLLLGSEWPRAMESLHRQPLSGGAIAWLIGMGFVLGLVLSFLCGALRPRFGPGLRTPLVAGLTAWLLAYVVAFGWPHVMGVFSGRIYWTTVLWTLLEVPLAAVVAGRVVGVSATQATGDAGSRSGGAGQHAVAGAASPPARVGVGR